MFISLFRNIYLQIITFVTDSDCDFAPSKDTLIGQIIQLIENTRHLYSSQDQGNQLPVSITDHLTILSKFVGDVIRIASTKEKHEVHFYTIILAYLII